MTRSQSRFSQQPWQKVFQYQALMSFTKFALFRQFCFWSAFPLYNIVAAQMQCSQDQATKESSSFSFHFFFWSLCAHQLYYTLLSRPEKRFAFSLQADDLKTKSLLPYTSNVAAKSQNVLPKEILATRQASFNTAPLYSFDPTVTHSGSVDIICCVSHVLQVQKMNLNFSSRLPINIIEHKTTSRRL